MEYKFFGRTGLRISQLGFGTMSFLGDADKATSARMFARCRDAGVNFFDCADVYNHGKSEELLGELIAEVRDRVVITTKAYFPTSKDPNGRGNSRYHLVRAVEASLRRLNTDYVDVFFLHRFDEQTALDETLRAVDDLVHSGKILYLGVSNFSAWQTMKAVGVAARDRLAPVTCVQPMYNLVKRQAEVELLPMAQSEQLAVVPYSPLAGGLLSGKYGRERRPSAGRLVDNAMYKTRYEADLNYVAAERLSEVAAQHGHHPASMAIAWVAAHPAVTAPLLGARSLEQLEPQLAALNVQMTPELYAELSAIFPAPAPATDRNEEKTAHNYGAR